MALIEQKIRDLDDDQRRDLRELVKGKALERDGRQCRARALVPEVRCAGELDPHEVIPRSAWKLGIYFLSNVLTVCRAHHRWIDNHPRDAHKLQLHGFSWEVPK